MRMNKYPGENPKYFLILGCAFVIGAGLRLYMLSSQILLDDEWHSICAVIGRTFLYVLTHFNLADNSNVFFNLYNLFLYRTVGWSEFTIRLPAIIPGLLSLVILPLLLRRFFNNRVSLLFAFLIAVSPFLIFYSRFSRAYSLVTLLCFSSLLLSCQWLMTGKKIFAAGFIITGVFAVYLHLYSIVTVFIPFAAAFGLEFLGRFNVLA
jgi:predicted membrane-bound mannosyltransferase